MMSGKPHLTFRTGRWHVWNLGCPWHAARKAATRWVARMNGSES